tara:strand:- start:231 stop:515 length:285 start_codon:yes stop_codon:yes gene_type:complete
LKKSPFLLLPLTLLLTINPSLANSNEDNWFDFGFTTGAFSQTCSLAVDKVISKKDAREEMEFIFDYAKKDLDKDFYDSFIEFAYEEKDCIKFLP